MRVKSLMGLKIWPSWGVDKKKSKSQQVHVFLKNHAQLQNPHMTQLFFDKFRGFLFKIMILRASRAYQAKPSLAKSSQARASNSQVKPRIF